MPNFDREYYEYVKKYYRTTNKLTEERYNRLYNSEDTPKKPVYTIPHGVGHIQQYINAINNVTWQDTTWSNNIFHTGSDTDNN